MTFQELLRLYADEVDRREAAEQQVKELEKLLEQVRSAALDEKPAQWLSVKEAAKYIGRPKSFLDKDRVLRQPQIPFRQEFVGGLVAYSRIDLDSYNESRMKGRKKAVIR